MKNTLSLTAMRENAVLSFKRFPCAYGYALALTITLLVMTATSEHYGVWIFYLSCGFLLSLLLALWSEEVGQEKKRLVTIVYASSHLLLAIDALVLWSKDNDLSEALYLAQSAIVVTLLLGIVYLPFLKQKDDVQSWNFVKLLLTRLFLSALVGLVMMLGVDGLILGFDQLFGIDMNGKVYIYTAIIFAQFLPQVLFLSRIPEGAQKHDDTLQVSGFINGLSRYLFIPLELCYMVVLYIYLGKILITWELPQGAVASMVTIMMFGLIVIEFLLYPTMRSSQAKPFETFVVRWLPILTFPLIMLMTVGIIRRLSDYGITTSRLYAITFNLWFYLVAFGLWWKQARRIHWISLSFGALLLISSAQPFNYSEIARLAVRSSLEKIIASNPPAKTPMTQMEFQEWIETLPEAERPLAYGKMQYLLHSDYKDDASKWVANGVYLWGAYEDQKLTEDRDSYVSFSASHRTIQIPAGYTRLVDSPNVDYHESAAECLEDDILTFDMEYNDNGRKHVATFQVDIREVGQITADSPLMYLKPTKAEEDMILIPNSLTIKKSSGRISVYGSGYLFLK